MRMSYSGWTLGHAFDDSSPEYFKNFTVPYRASELNTIRVDVNKEMPGRARMDATYRRTNVIQTNDSRKNKVTVTVTN